MSPTSQPYRLSFNLAKNGLKHRDHYKFLRYCKLVR